MVKVPGLTVIVPPARSPQSIACTIEPPESNSIPLTSGIPAGPYEKAIVTCPCAFAVAVSVSTTALS